MINDEDFLDTGPFDFEYKFDEDLYMGEIMDYIRSTYGQHYSSNGQQTAERIIANGRGEGFFLGNMQKYVERYGHKGDNEAWRADLLKLIHYAIMALYNHDLVYGGNEWDDPDFLKGE